MLTRALNPSRMKAWAASSLLAAAGLWLAVHPGRGDIVEVTAPVTPRDFYNDGTRKFREGKLREAEAALQVAVASNHEKLQPVALYNLGHVRFQQGVEALKNSANAQATKARGDRASELGDKAIAAADEALAGYDLDAIINAYLKGRGTRRQLKSAAEAVKRAMDSYSAVLSRWQRASGDFKSAYELKSSDADAKANGETVDRQIAALVDRLEMMQMLAQCLGNKRQDLKQRMQEMKKLLPKGQQQPGEGEDDEDEDEEEEEDQKPKAGQQEQENREGREMSLTPEEAARLLDSLKLDGNRKLPMGFEELGKPRDRKGREW